MTNAMTCTSCIHYCTISSGQPGKCQTRRIENNQLTSLSEGLFFGFQATQAGRIPLISFRAEQTFLKVGGFGCNLRCPDCKKEARKGDVLSLEKTEPYELIERAGSLIVMDNAGIVFSGGEPLVNWKFIQQTAQEARDRDVPIQIAVKTHGMINPAILDFIAGDVDVFVLDLKAFDGSVYEELHGSLPNLQLFMRRAWELAKIEVCIQIHPRYSNSVQQIRRLAKFMASIDADIPLVLYRSPSPDETKPHPITRNRLYSLQEVARLFLNRVYIHHEI